MGEGRNDEFGLEGWRGNAKGEETQRGQFRK